MRCDAILRRTLFAGTALALLTAAGTVPGHADDTAALAALLANKGVITASEAQAIRSAPPAVREGRLTAILRKKGVLGEEDMKSLGSQPGPQSRPVAVASPDPSSALAANTPAPPVFRKAGVTMGAFDIAPVGYVALGHAAS